MNFIDLVKLQVKDIANAAYLMAGRQDRWPNFSVRITEEPFKKILAFSITKDKKAEDHLYPTATMWYQSEKYKSSSRDERDI